MRATSRALWAPISLAVLALSVLSGCGRASHANASAKHAPTESVVYYERCPARDLRRLSSPEPRTATVLVPPHPTGALVCRYWGLDDPGYVGTVAASRSVPSVDALDRLAGRLDALPPFPTNPPPSCPADFGRSELIFFHYRGASDDPVHIVPGGCTPVSNGRLTMIGLRLMLGQARWPDESLL